MPLAQEAHEWCERGFLARPEVEEIREDAPFAPVDSSTFCSFTYIDDEGLFGLEEAATDALFEQLKTEVGSHGLGFHPGKTHPAMPDWVRRAASSGGMMPPTTIGTCFRPTLDRAVRVSATSDR